MDGVRPASADLAIAKARTAARLRRPTAEIEDSINQGRTAFVTADIMALRGGMPIRVNGEVVGAVGIAGLRKQTDSDMTRPSYIENADGYMLTKALMEWFMGHYADEADQELWHPDDPSFVFPPHAEPPRDRDRFLPVPPIPLEARERDDERPARAVQNRSAVGVEHFHICFQ